jgi:hypothetical protein
MLNEAMILGIVLAIVISAVAIYLYSYVSYLEKKVGMIETMVVDLRIAMDSILTDDPGSRVAAPISPSPVEQQVPSGAPLPTTSPAMPAAAEEGDESFYNSVLSQAHEGPEQSTPEEGISMEEALKGMSEEAPLPMEGMAGLPAAAAAVTAESSAPAPSAAPAVNANFDSMTRAELAAEAERRGLRVKRSMNRNEVLSLLRRAAPTQLQSEPAGAENASGLFPDSEQLPGSNAVDLGEV